MLKWWIISAIWGKKFWKWFRFNIFSFLRYKNCKTVYTLKLGNYVAQNFQSDLANRLMDTEYCDDLFWKGFKKIFICVAGKILLLVGALGDLKGRRLRKAELLIRRPPRVMGKLTSLLKEFHYLCDPWKSLKQTKSLQSSAIHHSYQKRTKYAGNCQMLYIFLKETRWSWRPLLWMENSGKKR